MTGVRPLDHDPLAPAPLPALTPSRRYDGWTAAAQRLFLEAIAEGNSVECAAARVDLSPSSAYAFRAPPSRSAGAPRRWSRARSSPRR